MKHVDEDIFQEFLDGGKKDASVTDHLSHCASCSKKLSEYETLFKHLSSERTEIPRDFTIKTVKAVSARRKKIKTEERLLNCLYFLAVAACAVFYLVRIDVLTQAKSWFEPIKTIFIVLFQNLPEVKGSFFRLETFTIFAVLTAAFLSDLIFLQKRRQKN
ncbi:hypothetical protein JXL83_08420 [candidate division WOR-3 bacterium]|nr:hypothetical protein [candidate division WOR-3 bacterium]